MTSHASRYRVFLCHWAFRPYYTGRPGVLNGAGPLGHGDVLVRKPYTPSGVVAILRGFLPATGNAG